MKTFFKVVGIVLLVVVALAAIGVSYLALRKPAQQPPSTERIEATARDARREDLGAIYDYLKTGRTQGESVSGCVIVSAERR